MNGFGTKLFRAPLQQGVNPPVFFIFLHCKREPFREDRSWAGCVDHIWVGRIPKDSQWHRYTILLKVPSFDAKENYLQLKIGISRVLTESVEIFELSMVGIDPIVRFEDPSLEDQGKHWRFEIGFRKGVYM